ncbi:hypothetical protein YC2023_029532 [Brassica napus]
MFTEKETHYNDSTDWSYLQISESRQSAQGECVSSITQERSGFSVRSRSSSLVNMCWNCQGIGSDLTVRRLREFRRKDPPDIMFLMETKRQDEEVFRMYQGTEFSNHFTVPPDGLSGGLALSWKDSVDLEILFFSPNVIDTKISFNGKTVFVSYIYGAPQRENRARFWELLSDIVLQRQAPWLITGDFNDLLDNSEKVGGPLRWEGSFLSFRNFVSQYDLWDLQFSGNSLSWRGTRYTHFIQSRLDRAMANVEWMEMFPAARSENLSFEGSDHRPIVTHFDQNLKKKKGSFRYDRSLSSKPEARTLIQDTWQEDSADTVLNKICKVRRNLINWAKGEADRKKEALRHNQAQLEEALTSASPNQERIEELQGLLEAAYAEEEAFWRQRSRIQWLSEGDKNSAYFHAVTRGRRISNKFSVIENDEGTAFYEEEQIVNTFRIFYDTLYTAGSTSASGVVQEALTPKISGEMNLRLVAIPDRVEVKAAVFAINSDKAPGPDGFSAGFYQSFWDIIGEDIYQEVMAFFESGQLHPRYNETHIRLIPKVKEAKRVSEFRPIALCNSHYKIIAKKFSKRMQPLLQSIISPAQSAFVPGRAISDNVLITHEILHYLRQSKAEKHVSMAVKTDMSKAYDRIEWSFLRQVLSRLGFHETFITWLMECVSSVSYSFLINGGPQGRVQPSRGLRQGDPLSPYLFILCTEVLSGLCNNALRDGTMPGVKVGRQCPPINHLLFADDTMFFGKSNVTSCQTLLAIINKYELVSGQRINKAKSAVTFSSKTKAEAKARVKRKLEISNEGGIGKYLGLPEHFGRRKRDIFASIVDRIRQRSHGWTARYLSGAGKMVLLKAVLSSMPNYAMSCFKLPKSLCKQIQSVLTRFWWDVKPEVRKMCWLSWDKMTLPKGAGGLRFREIEIFNDALLAKHAWRLLKDPSSLLAQTLLNKYCLSEEFLECSAPNASSHGWRGILAGREILRKGLGWVIGDGSSVNVWRDHWLSTEKQLCPIGPATAENQDLRVCDLFTSGTVEWNQEMLQLHLPAYEEHILRIVPSSFRMRDELMWLHEKTGQYTTKTGYALAKLNIADRQDGFRWRKCVWNVKCSPKLQHFLWKVKNDILAVGEALIKRGIQIDGKCKRCGESESALHVLFSCPFAKRIWDRVPAINKPSEDTVQTATELLQACSSMINLPPTGLSSPLYPWVMWVIWTSRNQLIFEDKSFSETEVMLKALKHAREWQLANEDKPKPPTASPKDCSANLVQNQVQDSVYRCHVDAAWISSSGQAGMGWTCSDPRGVNLFQGTMERKVVASALVAEALALRAALQDAGTREIQDLICLSDSKSLITLITGRSSVIALKGILHDIDVLSRTFASISFKFVPRNCNATADRLAKDALFALSSRSGIVTETF